MSDQAGTHFLKGSLEYAFVHAPKEKYKTTEEGLLGFEYVVNLLLDTPEAVEAYNALKVKYNIPDKINGYDKVRFKEDGTPYITLRRTAGKEDKLTKKIVPVTITVVDKNNNPIPSNIIIGNGSTANVAVVGYIAPSTKQGNLQLLGVQVLNLVEFNKNLFDVSDEGIPVVDTSKESESVDFSKDDEAPDAEVM